MTKRRAAIGLSLLCALVFCAFAAPGAMAVEGTTAAECEKAGSDFRGEHCLTTGKAALAFSHKAIDEKSFSIEGTNEKTASETTQTTNAVIKGKIGAVTLEMSAKKSVLTGSLTNEEPKAMKTRGPATITLSEFEGTPCVPKGGKLALEVTIETKTTAGGEMWVEYKGKKAKEVWAEFELEGGGCGLLKKLIKLKGAAHGTPTGATLEFKASEPKNALEFEESKEQAEYIVPETLRIVKGNPIVFTTTNP